MIFQQVIQSPSTSTTPGLCVLSLTGPPQASLALGESATTHSLFEGWLWGRTKLFKSTLAKNYFPDMLLPWLCWNKVSLCSGSRGRCVLWHKTSLGALNDCRSQPQCLCRALLGSHWPLFLIHLSSSSSSGPAFYSTHITAPLLSCNYESYWKQCWMNLEPGSFYNYSTIIYPLSISVLYHMILKWAISYQC